ncbi:hypothetical protein JCGZ_19568 [Jatropha curcas]|uniref:Uncharacterized protein n=1 Tax=Jatropha curcas TaxID=180498 RepID=A0A067JYL7_JATCU|nr:hypothetical protein JCGZ_19568 [Jatropha curcas]
MLVLGKVRGSYALAMPIRNSCQKSKNFALASQRLARPNRASQHARARQDTFFSCRVARADKGAIMMGCFVTRTASYLRAWNPARPVYDSVGGGKGTRLDLDVMLHMKLVEKVGDLYCIVGARGESPDEERLRMLGASNLSNDEVFACMMSRMNMFDTRLNGMESMIADRFQSIEIMHGSLNSHINTMQGQYQGIASQLQTVIQLLQPHSPPPPEY